MELLVHLVSKDLKVHKDKEVRPEQPDLKAHKENVVHKVYLVSKALKEKSVHAVLKVRKVKRVIKAILLLMKILLQNSLRH
jgi:hypothetical protein